MNIEIIIARLAFAEKLPKAAVEAALKEPEPIVSRTLDIIERFIESAEQVEGEWTVTEGEESALVGLLHILGELRERRLFAPLLRLFACRQQILDDILGDTLFDSGGKILISTYDGEPAPLLRLMNDPAANEFCRNVAFHAWIYLAAKEVWPRSESEKFLRDAVEQMEPKTASHVWVSWLNAVAILGFEDLVPLADRLYKEGRISVDVIGGNEIVAMSRDEFMDLLGDGLKATDQDNWLASNHLYPFEDTLAELSQWHCYSEDFRKERRHKWLASANLDTVVNERRNVGRNDPCPCGSGKKFKKCCLN